MEHRAAAIQKIERTKILKHQIHNNNNNDVLLEYYWQSAQCSWFLKNVLPEDGPVWLKHVAPNIECIYILMTF
jgi:uncharacterized protein YdeI (YjbR/CyaY-like superfamily)